MKLYLKGRMIHKQTRYLSLDKSYQVIAINSAKDLISYTKALKDVMYKNDIKSWIMR